MYYAEKYNVFPSGEMLRKLLLSFSFTLKRYIAERAPNRFLSRSLSLSLSLSPSRALSSSIPFYLPEDDVFVTLSSFYRATMLQAHEEVLS
jgi:hypothetical protein